ncbi:hypothetical protein K3495_g11586 [Podosphaera aphanis]|nr:hypothetical protein K3495_g11586 [Podosphaera aphanis]
MLRILKANGHLINSKGLIKIPKDLGLQMRVKSHEEEEEKEKWHIALIEELNKGTLERYSRHHFDSRHCAVSVPKEMIGSARYTLLDPDENLLSETLQWCRTTLAEAGYINFDVFTPGGKIPRRFEEVYLNLRDSATIHIAFNETPTLLETIKSLKGHTVRGETYQPLSGLQTYFNSSAEYGTRLRDWNSGCKRQTQLR